MRHITYHDVQIVLDLAARAVTLGTAIVAAWNARKAKRGISAANATLDTHSEELQNIRNEVNGRMSEVVSKIPQPPTDTIGDVETAEIKLRK